MAHQHLTPGMFLPVSPDAATILTDYAAFLRDTWGPEAPQTPEAIMTDALRMLCVRYREFARWMANGHTHIRSMHAAPHRMSNGKKRRRTITAHRPRTVRAVA